ncbi:DUF4349 domain-containing protein [Xanthovirga aplysinae]|uniref:DUF4349 domain-containing protein n=1 Tax=Xanthovirga aplysinae TaxID=2529853 RepID=UPI0012BD2053|nr:DUF4349 domain-containing protein [Xanthovirga aplysinae]MTI33095.1 DUF4349 domain-containing protein [Xanthovirga aplysinae]
MRILFLLLILFFSAACQNAEEKMYMVEVSEEYEEVHEIPATMQAPLLNKATDTEQITKKVIKTGGIHFQSENIEEDYKKIRELLPQYNSYIENENQSKSSQRINYNLTIRVPASVYDSLYSSLSTLPFRLDSKYSNIEDVTERYYDLKTRIKNKKELEKRYLELLKKASSIKDILEIEKNLNQVRIDIERLEGQFRYLSKQVNFSTINLSFYEILPYVYDSAKRKGFGARILSALDKGWQGFLSFLITLTTLWPFVILFIGGIYLIRKLGVRWKRKK